MRIFVNTVEYIYSPSDLMYAEMSFAQAVTVAGVQVPVEVPVLPRHLGSFATRLVSDNSTSGLVL